ncbi:MAG: hypothetical protein R3B70_33900 [Polyangiaceae bacterium]
MRPSPRTVPGTGLAIFPYALLIALSVGLFLFWDGPLWRAEREASHVGRFAFSYLLVIPAAAALLLLARRFTVSHLVAATASAWGIKLVITSALYFSLARGTAFVPPRSGSPVSSKTPLVLPPDYRPAKGDFAAGKLTGTVTRGADPVPGAVVFIDRPAPGLPPGEDASPVHVIIEASRHDHPLFTAFSGAELDVTSRDSVLHTYHLYDGPRAVSNVPVPADGKAHAVTLPDPGVYEARCDTHEGERSALVVTDHPYITRTGPAGELSLASVPAGPVMLVVVTPGQGQGTKLVVRRVPARVEKADTTEVHIDLSTPEVAEERL